MALILKQYKHKSGEVNFPAVFNVPTVERLPAMYEKDFMKATALVVAALTMAFEKMVFKTKVDGVMINNLAEEILLSADEDNLAMEDLVLFLQNMVRGKYGTMESLSVARFMSQFDKYRDERHAAILEYRENEHLQFKGLGTAERSHNTDALSEHFARLGETFGRLKQDMRELKTENKKLRDIDNF